MKYVLKLLIQIGEILSSTATTPITLFIYHQQSKDRKSSYFDYLI